MKLVLKSKDTIFDCINCVIERVYTNISLLSRVAETCDATNGLSWLRHPFHPPPAAAKLNNEICVEIILQERKCKLRQIRRLVQAVGRPKRGSQMLLDVQMHSQLLLGMDLQIQVRIAIQWPPIADCLCAVYSTGTVHEANIGRKPKNKNQCGHFLLNIK